MAAKQSSRSLEIRGPRGKRTTTYRSWNEMRSRCNNPNSISYRFYGAIGIKHCKRWNSFDLFYEDMGPRPAGMTIDRIDGTKDYFPENCRWATSLEQSQNTKSVKRHDGKNCQNELARKYGIAESTLRYRLSSGWRLHDALSTKPDSRNRGMQGVQESLRKATRPE